MTEAFQTLLAAGLAWFGVFAIATLAGASAYPCFRRLATHAPASVRGVALFLYGVLPLLVATLVVCLLNFSALYSLFLPAHCHGGSCGPHAPEFASSAAQSAAAVATMLVLPAVFLWLPVLQLSRALSRSRLARHFGRPAAHSRDHGRYRVIDSREPMAWCDGLWRPTVYVSSGLIERLSATELAVVLAHENAHARRHDNLMRLSLDLATRLWPRRVRQALARDFCTAAELACDAVAARRPGGAERVASVIEQLGVAERRHANGHAAHWHAGTTNDRLTALRDDGATAEPAALAPWAALVGLWLAESYALTLVAHPVLEWLGR